MHAVDDDSPGRRPLSLYRVRLGIGVASSWTFLLVVCTVYFAASDSETRFLHWGPSDVLFGGFVVNTWPRWGLVMLYSMGSQFAYSVSKATLSPYISNVIRDHKTRRDQKGSYCGAQGIVFVYTLFSWITGVYDVFVYVTMQLQFILPAMLADMLLTVYLTHPYLRADRAPADLLSNADR